MKSPDNHFDAQTFFLRSWHPYMWLFLIASFPYLHILGFSEYTYQDDHFLIVESFSHINKLSGIGHAFFEDVSHMGQGGNLYRPLLTIFLIVSAQISGTMPFGYHLMNILLHCISCCILFYTLQLLGFKRGSSFWGALIFCVHPALTQTVAWIAGMNDSLLAIFILLSFITYSKYCATPMLKWYVLHLLCFACAMFTKESAILFPVLALWYSLGLRKEKLFSLSTLLFLVGWGIILINWHILRSAAMIVPIGDKFQAAVLVLSSLPTALYYVGKIFWPVHLAFAPIVNDISLTAGILSAAALTLAILLSERRDWKMIAFGAVWFLAFLLPTFYHYIGVLIPPKFYEHRIYLPCMGILFILLSLSYTNKARYIKRFLPPIVFLVFVYLGCRSYLHTFNFKDSLALAEYDAKSSPNDPRRYIDISRMNIPQKLYRKITALQGGPQRRSDKRTGVTKEELWNIIDDLRTERTTNPHDPELNHALAVAYYARSLFLSSEKNFLAAIQENPRQAMIRYNLGILYYSAHAALKAERAWQEALQVDSTMGSAHLNLSYLYYELGQYQSAWDHCQRAIQLGTAVSSDLVNEIRKKFPE